MFIANLDANIFMVAQSAEQFREEQIARIAVNKMQQRVSVSSAESQAHVAIHTPDFCRIDKRQRVNIAVGELIRVADGCQGFIIPALLIGLKVNGIEFPAADVPAELMMSDKFQIHTFNVY